jgi:hypothetical protein
MILTEIVILEGGAYVEKNKSIYDVNTIQSVTEIHHVELGINFNFEICAIEFTYKPEEHLIKGNWKEINKLINQHKSKERMGIYGQNT